MDQNFVAKEKRRDGKEHGCETCHGDPFEALHPLEVDEVGSPRAAIIPWIMALLRKS